MANNMEEEKKVIVVAKAGAIELVVEGEKADYELVLSKRQATKLAFDIMYKATDNIKEVENLLPNPIYIINQRYNP